MVDVTDPQVVEEGVTLNKLYKRRWLVLFGMFSLTLVVGLNRSILPITDILELNTGISSSQYKSVQQMAMYSTMISVFIVARGLDHFGIRGMTHLSTTILGISYILKALCLADNRYIPQLFQPHRYSMLLVSEILVGFASSIAFCVPAKLANTWFAYHETTLALVIAESGYNVGASFSNYLTPLFVQAPKDLYKLSYMFLISPICLIFIVASCITRSCPKTPPSIGAIISSSTQVPLRNGLMVMLSQPSYILLLIVMSADAAIYNVEQIIEDEILINEHYTDSFCGTLIAQSYFFMIFFTLIAAAWIDNSANYVQVSRLAAIVYAITLTLFNISIILPKIEGVILATNVMLSLTTSLRHPALYQVAIRSAMTILSEASVAATYMILQQIFSSILINLVDPLKSLSLKRNGYQVPILIFAWFAMVINICYATSFRAPSRRELQQKLSSQRGEVIREEEL